MGIPKTIVHHILSNDLKKRTLCAQFAPHVLIAERVVHTKDLHEMIAHDPNFYGFDNQRRRKLLFLIRSRNEKAECGLVWREFAKAEKIEVSKVKNQDDVDLVF